MLPAASIILLWWKRLHFLPSIMILYYTERGIEENNAVQIWCVFRSLGWDFTLPQIYSTNDKRLGNIFISFSIAPINAGDLLRFSLGILQV